MNYTHQPVVRTILADLLTPVALYNRLAGAPYTYLLESVEGGERWARYSMIGLPAREVATIRDHHLTIRRDGAVIEERELTDPLAWLADYHATIRPAPLPVDLPFSGGLVGYLAYDSIGYIEKRLAKRPQNDPLGVPDILYMQSLDVAVLDNLRGEVHLISHADLADPNGLAAAEARLDAMVAAINRPGTAQVRALNRHARPPAIQHHYPEAQFKADVAKIREYIKAGDCMQVVPSQRMSCAYTHAPLDYYRALRHTNPSPYMYLLDLDDFHIIGSSPEILARVQGDTVTVRPLAGTRKRGKTPEEDKALEQELLADAKEIAEHVMLIDLGRNDIGRVCKAGSVKISEKMVIERYSHVMHIVSNVEGTLRDDVGPMDVLRATFPAGTLSGAPKIRAMEIIDEVEPERRGVYGGAVGYWSWGGNMDMAIAIRTAIIKDGRLYAQAGAGIVYDSNPDSEWQETLNKAGAVIAAASLLDEGE
ncbi:anthranilate synthase component I [Cardiobacterium valvarum]|uniref:Anthranilate synthase component 1 n=1 Tax=Cardiobacterium valvarum F0432 TaxID=797473 RepID=G9ZE95_9GAMM|nr:anthranilate synthase component I [Cardiobacterium valvarum]EHM54854.1 anthranilate synthase component I [Cardiobacterium valvarum F0432]